MNTEHKYILFPEADVERGKKLISSWLSITGLVFLSLICAIAAGVFFLFLLQTFAQFDFPINLVDTPFIAFLLAIAFVGAILSFVFARLIVRPINQLRDATRKVSSGDFSVQIKNNSNTDVGQLIRDFNQMVRELGSIETFRNDFIANVSHEFKTPISAIEGYSALLKSENINDEERLEYADMVSENARKLSMLTTNILRLSKLENQEYVPEQSTFSLDEQIRRCILAFERNWEAKALDLDIELDHTMITSCEELLDLVWTNLISNAIKFTDDGGLITIRLTSESGCTVSIKDNGIGMDREVLDHIFDKFYQGDKSRSRHGNGLGLALVKQILDLIGGSIEVKSSPGEGSEFIVRLPIYK